ncbi:MAG: Fe-S oxidoreductase [Arthrobacter sp.]|nr:Fe-S oxidoreductase [Arthrobacter sp.]
MRIALFATCIVDAMYPATARATVKILERLGHEVVFPSGQACCGQMHVNSGYLKEAVPVIANHVAAFDTEDYDVAVAPSGSCVASVKHQHPMVARSCGDTVLEARATAVGAKTYELSELLVDVLGVTDAGAQLGSYFPHRVTYHPSCHGMRLLRLGDRPARLLRSGQSEALTVGYGQRQMGDICLKLRHQTRGLRGHGLRAVRPDEGGARTP